MAQFNHRVDLTQEEFPLLSTDKGHSVLVSSFKNAPTGEKANTPQVTYMHNVMPVESGYVSVGYEEVVPAATARVSELFTDIRLIFGDLGGRTYLGITSDGHGYSLDYLENEWEYNVSATALSTDLITVGTVKGQSYIYVTSLGCYEYIEATDTYEAVALTAVPISNVLGCVASSGYLILFNATELAWSSTIDPTDFTPSTVTGAGFGSVSDLEGDIAFVVPNSLGLLIYTSANAVAATYTGNKKYPFKLKSVDNSKGALGLDYVAYEANSADHFAYTKGGLQTVNSRSSTNLLPHFTDFLAGKRFEDYDEVLEAFSVIELTTTMKKKVKLIASRYLVISYGIIEFTHALVYDITLKRVGKLKITHADCFEYLGSQVEISKESIGFLLKDGSIKILKYSVPTAGRSGVLMLGKYQYTRDRHLVLHEVLADTVEAGDTFTFTDLVAVDGKNTTPVTATETIAAGYRTYKLRSSGLNHSLLFTGEFNLNTISMVFSLGGRR